MRKIGKKQVAALALGLALAGCETTERVVPGSPTTMRQANDPGERETREDVLVEATEDHPDDPQVWWQLGDYYETGQAWAGAIAAYQHMKVLIDQSGQKYTAGDYHLGRVYVLSKQYPEAVRHLEYVVKMQPDDVSQASINSHFREAHYLLGGIYYEHKQWKPAREHFVTFRELGGELDRVEPWLARIDESEWEGDVPTRQRAPKPRDGKPRPANAPNTPAAPAPASGTGSGR